MSVEPAELYELCRSTRNTVDELASAFGSVELEIVRTADGWVGASGSAFDAHWGVVRSHAHALMRDLGRIATDLEDARRGYIDTDDSAARHTAVLNLD